MNTRLNQQPQPQASNKKALLSLLFLFGLLTGSILTSALLATAKAEDSTAKAVTATAETPVNNTKKETQNTHETARHHKLVIQVSTDDLRVQQIALNNAVNLQKHYGMDNIDIEIVAYGPGLRMLTKNHTLASRISSLTYQDVKFSACGNTMHSIKEKTGFMPKLVEGVNVVHAGVARIIELQEQGYTYVRP